MPSKCASQPAIGERNSRSLDKFGGLQTFHSVLRNDTGFLHLNSHLLMLTRVEVLQTSENPRNHNAGPMIFCRFYALRRNAAEKKTEQADRGIRIGKAGKV